jgi:hypothetical protein
MSSYQKIFTYTTRTDGFSSQRPSMSDRENNYEVRDAMRDLQNQVERDHEAMSVDVVMRWTGLDQQSATALWNDNDRDCSKAIASYEKNNNEPDSPVLTSDGKHCERLRRRIILIWCVCVRVRVLQTINCENQNSLFYVCAHFQHFQTRRQLLGVKVRVEARA